MESLRSEFVSLTGRPGLVGIWAFVSYILWYIITATKAWFRLRKFPGPTFASVSTLWAYYAMKSGRNHLIFSKEQKKYGKLTRIGPNELIVYDVDTMLHINAARSTYPRSPWYASLRFNPYGHDVLSQPNTALHDKMKAKITSAYGGKGDMNLEKDVDSQVAIMTDIIRNKILGGDGTGLLDFSRLIKFFQVDLITLIGVGEPWGDLTTDTDRFDFISFVAGYAPVLNSFPMIPLLRDIFSSKAWLIMAGPKHTDSKGLGAFLG